jgi:hypothetical protein
VFAGMQWIYSLILILLFSTEAYLGLQLVRCFALSQLIFIRIDKMFFAFLNKIYWQRWEPIGIATDFFSICLKLLSLRQKSCRNFTTLLTYLVRRKDVTCIAHVTQQSFFAMIKTFYVLRINHYVFMECFMYYVLVITPSWNVFGQNEKKQVDMTWNF